ncbi:uncharacterized protein [Littorina saxatilis]
MLRHHVTTVAAILVCNLLLCSAHPAPNAALLKLIAAKHSHGSHRLPSPYTGEYSAPYPETPAASDASDFWSNLRNVAISAGSPLTDGEGEEGEDTLTQHSETKRFHPSAFVGSRGKRMFGDLSDDEAEAFEKRFQQGFIGSRGRRMQSLGGAEGEGETEAFKRFQQGFTGSRGKRMGAEGENVAKRFDPSGFSGSRGKRYIPGLQALFLSQMYNKCEYCLLLS